jgi:hypothetical protein
LLLKREALRYYSKNVVKYRLSKIAKLAREGYSLRLKNSLEKLKIEYKILPETRQKIAELRGTNYTLTIQDDGKVVWETMQTSEKAGIVFRRREIDLNIEKMQGILSQRIDDKTTRDYAFVSVSKKATESQEKK